MILKIRNFRGIETADIEVADTITVIGADNGDGKSSIAQAVGAVLSGTTIPFEGVSKADAKALIRVGADAASVELIDGENGASIKWPECVYSTIKQPPTIPSISAGLESFMGLKPTERINLLIELMRAMPTIDELRGACDAAELFTRTNGDDTTWFQSCWQTIQTFDWDMAEKHYRDEGTKLKIKWEAITNERFGVRKADGWQPKTWAADLADATAEALQSEVDKQREYVQGAERASALTEDKRVQYDAMIAAIPTLAETATQHEASVKALQEQITANEGDRAELVKIATAYKCPGCEMLLRFHGNLLVKLDSVADGDTKASLARIEAALITIRQSHATILKKRVAAQHQLDEATKAQKILETAKIAQAGEATDLDDARKRLEHAEERLKAFADYTKAARLTDKLDACRKLISILSPKGIRQTKLDGALLAFNAALTDLATVAKWSAAAVRVDGSVVVGDLPYSLLSESEQYRVDRLFQLLVSSIRHARFVVIDRADTLLRKTRVGLLRAIIRAKIAAIVFVAVESAADLPNVSKVNGRRYFISDRKAMLCD